jgi:predicted small lipoprotein YifL
MLRKALLIVALLALIGALGACGRKGDVEAPPGAPADAPTLKPERDQRGHR